jgi:hypothetical protein
MLAEFHEFYRGQRHDDDSIVAFDASALLDLFRLKRAAANNVLNLIERIPAEKRFIPHQAAVEYHRNLEPVLSQIAQELNTYKAAFTALVETAGNHRKHPHLTKSVTDQLNAVSALISSEIEAQVESIRSTLSQSDDFKRRVASLFAGAIGPAPSSEERKALERTASERYAQKVPPGYRDAGKKDEAFAAGDYIVWTQMMDRARVAKCNLVFVTQDQKEDWFWVAGGMKLGPRPELRREFRDATGHEFSCMPLAKFFETRPGNSSALLEAALDSLESLRIQGHAQTRPQSPMEMMLSLMKGLESSPLNRQSRLGSMISTSGAAEPEEIDDRDEESEGKPDS